MVAHVTSTLATHDRIERIIVLAQQTELLAHHEDTGWMARDERIAFVASGAGISSSLLDIMEKGKARYPLLVTTADNVLLDHSMIDSFLDGVDDRSEEHTYELQSLMRISYAVFCLKKKHNHTNKSKKH